MSALDSPEREHPGRLVALILVAGLLCTLGCRGEAPLRGNLRIVIGSKSTGGDTYQVSSLMAEALSRKLGRHVKVDAVGAPAAFRLMRRIPNGSTIMIFHDQAYLGELYGHKGYVDIFDDFQIGPTFATNPGNAYLVRKTSPYQTFDDVVRAVRRDEIVRVAIQPGGVSEIGFSAMKHAIKLQAPGKEANLVALHTGSQADKNQQLFDAQATIINGTVQANEQFTQLAASDQKAMRFLWLTARRETIERTGAEGIGDTSREELLEFVAPRVQIPMADGEAFTFDKEFFFLFHKDTAPEIIAYLDRAIAEIFAEGQIQQAQERAFFVPNFRPAAEARAHLRSKRAAYAEIIQAIRTPVDAAGTAPAAKGPLAISIDFERSHWFFPRIVLVLLAIVGIALLLRKRPWRTREHPAQSSTGRRRLLATVALVVMYFLGMDGVGNLAPNQGVGFLGCSTLFVFSMSLLSGRQLSKRLILTAALTAVLAPLVSWYVLGQLFDISLP
jgi:tripartite-type tricarboxylate transporter receptor subunit TctC